MLVRFTLEIEKEVDSLKHIPEDAEIISVDGDAFIDRCEVCGGPVVEGDSYLGDAEGVVWHKDCD